VLQTKDVWKKDITDNKLYHLIVHNFQLRKVQCVRDFHIT